MGNGYIPKLCYSLMQRVYMWRLCFMYSMYGHMNSLGPIENILSTSRVDRGFLNVNSAALKLWDDYSNNATYHRDIDRGRGFVEALQLSIYFIKEISPLFRSERLVYHVDFNILKILKNATSFISTYTHHKHLKNRRQKCKLPPLGQWFISRKY